VRLDGTEIVGYAAPIAMSVRARHVITEMGLCNALGNATAEVWRAVVRGERQVSTPAFELPFVTVCGAVSDKLAPVPAAYVDFDTRLARLALCALEPMLPAIEKTRARLGAERIGVVMGTSTGGLDATEAAYRRFRAKGERTPDFSLRRAHSFDALPQLLASLCSLEGPRYAISTACTSSAKALASATRLIDAGVCDAVLVGGADVLCETTLRGFQTLGVLSETGSRPFSAERTGIHIGEGAAFLLVERNGEGPLHVLSVGETSDAHSMSAPHPEGLGAARAIEVALERAGLSPSAIGYVNAHGTGTDQNDATESQAIRATLGARVPVSSTKGLTGHLLGACGATEAIFAGLAIIHGALPMSAGAEPVDPNLGIHVLTRSVEAQIRHALSTSFAFGGSNAAVILGAA